MTPQLVCQTVVVQYAIYTSVMWKLEACSAQTLRMVFTVKEETSKAGKLLKFEIFAYSYSIERSSRCRFL